MKRSVPIIAENWVEFISICLIFFDLFFEVLPTLPFAFLVLCLVFVRLKLVDIIVISILVLPNFFGTLLHVHGISGIGGYFNIFAFLLVIYGKTSHKLELGNFVNCFLPMIVIFVLMAISVFTTTGGDYAPQKLIRTMMIGTISFIAFTVLFCNIYKSDCIRLGLYFIMFGIFFLRISSIVNEQPGPANFLDFGFMREADYYSENEDFRISYHVPGLVALRGMGFIMLHSIYKRINNSFLLFCLVLCCLISLYAGGRQFVVAAIGMVAIWLYFGGKKSKKASFILLIGGLGALAVFVYYLFSAEGMMGTVSSEGYLAASRRDLPLLRGVELFLDHPIWGCGYGRYNLMGEYHYYPHNLFVEILCEMGIVGMLVFMLVCIKPIKKSKQYLPVYIYLLAFYFFRAMASESLESNIAMFSMIFALPLLCNKTKLLNG